MFLFLVQDKWVICKYKKKPTYLSTYVKCFYIHHDDLFYNPLYTFIWLFCMANHMLIVEKIVYTLMNANKAAQ